MDGWVFSFITVCISALIWFALPPLAILPILLLLCIVCLYLPYGKFASGGLMGVIWIASVGHWQLHWQLSLPKTSQVTVVQGQINSLIRQQQRVVFNLSVEQLENQSQWLKPTIRLSWQNPDWHLKQGQSVQLEVKLKPPHGLANEGGFNYQQWLFSQGIVASGYVRNSVQNQLLANTPTIRQQLMQRFSNLPLDNKAWLAALSFGYRGWLQADDWQLVQRTGIAHLIAISGLHLGIVVSVSYWIFAFVVVRISAPFSRFHHINAHRIALCMALFGSFAYASLAGFSLPTLRAFLALLLVTVIFLLNRHWRAGKLLLYALWIIVLCFPLSLFGVSLWLSFAALLIIWLVFWRWPVTHSDFSFRTFLLTLCRVQLALSLLMLPIVAWQFGMISVISPLVNLLAVPLVTLVLVPLCLLATMLLLLNIEFAGNLFALADYLFGLALKGLNVVADWQFAGLMVVQIPLIVWCFFTLGLLLLFIPKLPIPKAISWVCLLPLLSYLLPAKQSGWRIDVLDVGQGLSVLISKNNQAILYDTGASYPSGFNMADAVILPLLKSRGISKLDKVFISHSDNDHSGSSSRLSAVMPIGQLLTNKDLCTQGLRTKWQGLQLSVLWPQTSQSYSDNDGSCVLMISDGKHKILLPGDITTAVEKQLVNLYPQQLAANILLAPHHGSNTSSSAEFIQYVQPQYVVFSQGYLNRWGFPKQSVIQRYQLIQAKLFNTSTVGQVSFFIDGGQQQRISVQTFREDLYPYWYAN